MKETGLYKLFVTQIVTDQASILSTEPSSNNTEQATGESGDATQTFLISEE